MSIPDDEPGWAHLERLRADELRTALPMFPETGRVLELGAVSGFLAAWLTRLGYDVSAVDVEPGGEEHPVAVYDGVNLPFGAAEFDVVFSSNVLEHVRDLPGLLDDVRRVLRPGGLMISILPSSTWRWWTSVAHYPFIVKYAITRRLPTPSRHRATAAASPTSLRHLVRTAIAPRAHGEFPTAVHELWTFRRRWWIRQLTEAGFVVTSTRSLGLFYTGYSIAEHASIDTRHRAAKVLGSSTFVVVARSGE